MAQRGFEWPNQARIAVVVTCLLENWSEGKGPPFSVQTTALKPGTPRPRRDDLGHVWRARRGLAASENP